jgi:GDP-D-mannose 3',5'-epimerase
LAYHKNYGLQVRIGRYHNVYGPEGAWNNGKEKAPAALCRKVALCDNDKNIVQIWGDGQQTRSFLYIDEALEGTIRLMRSTFTGPFNIGSDEMISINNLAKLIAKIADKNIKIQNIEGPLGVRGRCSDNNLIFSSLGWRPKDSLADGLSKHYSWVLQQVKDNKLDI